MSSSGWTPAEQALIERVYGIGGRAEPLPAERTRNALLTSGTDRFVVKLHPGEALSDVELECAALDHLAGLGIPGLPRVLRARDGRAAVTAELNGANQVVQVLSWLPGATWAATGPHPARAMGELGSLVARVDAGLESFADPGIDRSLSWNLVRAAAARDLLPHVPDAERRDLAGVVLDRFAAEVEPRLAQLPWQPIHNDANDSNVLVGPDGGVTGLIDFADLCRAPRVCGLAVACAYTVDVRSGPWTGTDAVRALLPLVAGYHEVAPLDPLELELLPDLIRTRLALSVAMAGWQHGRDPANAYLLVSQDQVWALLRLLVAEDPRLTLCRLRDACGYEPDPSAREVRQHLAVTAASPVLGAELARMPRLTFDWSAGTGAGSWTPERLSARLAEAGAQVGIGRYLEDRDVYTSGQYAPEDSSGERRTVHLGVDLFVPEGSGVFAPLDGVVHAAHDNASPLDYGPVVILEHRTGAGVPFFTLFGHLSRETLDVLEPGREVKAGERIATVGRTDENGGWAPHVHVQLLTDLLGRGTDVPGVCPRSEVAVWQSVAPDPNLLLGIPEGTRADPGLRSGEVARVRRTSMSAALSLSYAEPLHIVRGEGAYLFDGNGNAWLDLVNNVAHVGHCHPRVAAAAARQQVVLNTNTRYLHGSVARYARRLVALLPDPLAVCFLVNSGSEANDLALRLAYAHTGSREVVVLDHAYHGNLTSLVDVSPYKFDGPGGRGRPPHTHVVPMPDRSRCGDDPGESLAALDQRLATIAAAGAGPAGTGGPAALLAEAIPGTAGQVVLAEGFLAEAYRRVRAAGGVCIADEVQTGFGRVGRSFWAFESHRVVPDIVTLGKPIGNGHPIGAVVTTPRIARSFVTGMEYFNTFGGNPVSAEVGLAVLDVLADEGLQANALRLGEHLLSGLRELQDRHPLVGDVRGSGLFLGVELVTDRATRRPAAAAADRGVEAVKRRGVLLSSDGPGHNVLKIKPPMVVSQADCDRFLLALDEALDEVSDEAPGGGPAEVAQP